MAIAIIFRFTFNLAVAVMILCDFFFSQPLPFVQIHSPFFRIQYFFLLLFRCSCTNIGLGQTFSNGDKFQMAFSGMFALDQISISKWREKRVFTHVSRINLLRGAVLCADGAKLITFYCGCGQRICEKINTHTFNFFPFFLFIDSIFSNYHYSMIC